MNFRSHLLLKSYSQLGLFVLSLSAARSGDRITGDHPMHRYFYALAGLSFALVPFTSDAADLALKSKPLAYPIDGQGCYFGINAEAGAAQTNVSGNALFVTSLAGGNLMAAGGSVGGTVGCIKGNATRWFAVQASANYANISGSVGTLNALGTVGV